MKVATGRPLIGRRKVANGYWQAIHEMIGRRKVGTGKSLAP